MEFKNDKELQKYFNDILEKIINNVSEKVFSELQKHILNTIYSPQEGWYKRYGAHGGFLSGWELDKLQSIANQITRNIYFNPDNLISPSRDSQNNGYAHGDVDDNIDRRNQLPIILNSEGWNAVESEFGGAYYPRNTSAGYWDEFINYLDNNIWQWFDKECKKYGIRR